MKIMAKKHRSVRHLPGRHMFAARNDLAEAGSEFFYDGSTEEYMAFRVAKVGYDQWRMRVRFRQNILDPDKDNQSFVDDFQFDWLRNGHLQAWYSAVRVVATQG